jgi:hypothetical protein
MSIPIKSFRNLCVENHYKLLFINESIVRFKANGYKILIELRTITIANEVVDYFRYKIYKDDCLLDGGLFDFDNALNNIQEILTDIESKLAA